MRLSIAWRGLAAAIGLATSAGAWAANQDIGPAAIFAGCDGDDRPPAEVASPRDRIERAPKVDRFSQRAFASFSMDEIESRAAAGSCWARLDGADFYRPEPNNSQAAMEAQIPGNDPFLLSSNLEYLAASRRGYDIALQDPFYLNSNDKLEIFEEINPRYYYIAEKRVIPVTFSYIPESSQGTVYRKSLMSSEKYIQETTSHSFGASIETGYQQIASETSGQSGSVGATLFGVGLTILDMS